MEIEFKKIIEKMGSKEKAINFIIQQIIDNKIEFPYSKTFLPNPKIMYDNLCNYNPNIIKNKYKLYSYYPLFNIFDINLFKNEYVYIETNIDNYERIDGLTDHFTEDIRNNSRKKYNMSVYESWKNRDFLYVIFNQLSNLTIINNEIIRKYIYINLTEPGLFRLTWGKSLLYAIFNNDIKNPKKILDISAGWGDRLLLSISLNYEYLGYDPNINLKNGHDKIIQMFGNPEKHKIIYTPFETANINNDYYDLVFSSPPFFNLELYSLDSSQSCIKYPNFNDWIVNFLFMSLFKSWNSLKNNGYLIIHMADTREYSICEPMNLFINQYLINSHFQGIIGISGIKKKNSPVWIWKKNASILKSSSIPLLTDFYPNYEYIINKSLHY